MRVAALILLIMSISACSVDPFWFKADSWFADKPVSEAAPDYIPLAAVPLRPDLVDWSQAQRKKQLQALEKKMIKQDSRKIIDKK